MTDTLRPYLSRFEQEIHRKLMPSTGRNSGRYFVRFDVRERLRGDFQTTMQGYALGKQWRWFNTNGILEEIGKNPIPRRAGERYWMPLNMQDAAAPTPPPDPLAQQPPGAISVLQEDKKK